VELHRFYIHLLVGLLFSCQSFGQVIPKMVDRKGNLVTNGEDYLYQGKALRNVTINNMLMLLNQKLESGTTTLGNIDLKKLSQELTTVKLFIVDPEVKAIGVGQSNQLRGGSVYIIETHSLYLNAQNIDLRYFENERIANLLNHELLGALGYDDANYQISAPLMSQELPKISATTKKSKTDFSKKVKSTPILNKENTDGGVTVVGGGGDEILLDAKIFMLDHLPTWLAALKNESSPERQQLKELIAEGLTENFLSEDLFDDYLLFFLKAQFENIGTAKYPSDINQAYSVQILEDSTLRIGLVREGWGRSIGKMSSGDTMLNLNSQIHTKLFSIFLKQSAK
jgi:hypothetical protein